jgi:hypothetical protein
MRETKEEKGLTHLDCFVFLTPDQDQELQHVCGFSFRYDVKWRAEELRDLMVLP